MILEGSGFGFLMNTFRIPAECHFVVRSKSLQHSMTTVDYLGLNALSIRVMQATLLIATIKLRQRETQCKVGAVRLDGGREFVNHVIPSFYRREGLKQKKTVRYSPEQNGRVERLNRDVMEKARPMMFQCGAPQRLWAEAVAAASKVCDAISHMQRDKTPFELFYGQKPDLCRLRVLGCTAHVHVPKEQKEKLDERSEEGMLVGYSTTSKAWRIAFQTRNRIVIVERGSVVFDERTLGALTSCQPPAKVKSPTSNFADTVAIASDDMGENVAPGPPTAQAPAADVEQNQYFDFDATNLPPLPDLNEG